MQLNLSAFQTVCARVDEMAAQQPRLLVAIDGRCGSGKTTLGNMLAEKYRCTLLHMDDFYLRAEQRTPERLSAPGGNVDYERFTEEILQPIRAGEPVFLRKFCHDTFQPGEAQPLAITPLVLVEGSYSCHTALRGYYDLRIFLSTDAETQLARIRERSGPEKYPLFVSRWIPMEERYFSGMDVEACCHLSLRT